MVTEMRVKAKKAFGGKENTGIELGLYKDALVSLAIKEKYFLLKLSCAIKYPLDQQSLKLWQYNGVSNSLEY